MKPQINKPFGGQPSAPNMRPDGPTDPVKTRGDAAQAAGAGAGARASQGGLSRSGSGAFELLMGAPRNALKLVCIVLYHAQAPWSSLETASNMLKLGQFSFPPPPAAIMIKLGIRVPQNCIQVVQALDTSPFHTCTSSLGLRGMFRRARLPLPLRVESEAAWQPILPSQITPKTALPHSAGPFFPS